MKPAALLLLLALPASAHEFWIDPQVADGTLTAHLRVGEDLRGDTLSYLPTTIASMRYLPPGGAAAEIGARIGDMPAIAGVALGVPGLHRLAVETLPAYIVFDDMAEFGDYLAYEGQEAVLDAHRARGLPETGIAEEYLRHARALVQVGPVGAGAGDTSSGMAFELVADGTPFAPDRDTLDLSLTWRGAPEADTQVALFHLPAGGAAGPDTVRGLHRTDAAGRVTVPLAGPGTYLLNAVRIEPAHGPGSVVWRSHWASLTFTLPSP